jgi:hypothetical protein
LRLLYGACLRVVSPEEKCLREPRDRRGKGGAGEVAASKHLGYPVTVYSVEVSRDGYYDERLLASSISPMACKETTKRKAVIDLASGEEPMPSCLG